MYGTIIDGRPALCGHVRVRHPRDIEFLVKEAEVVTGMPGRVFVIAGAGRPTFRIRSNANGYEVQRLDAGQEAGGEGMFVLSDLFSEHRLGSALRSGCLFTPVLGD